MNLKGFERVRRRVRPFITRGLVRPDVSANSMIVRLAAVLSGASSPPVRAAHASMDATRQGRRTRLGEGRPEVASPMAVVKTDQAAPIKTCRRSMSIPGLPFLWEAQP